MYCDDDQKKFGDKKPKKIYLETGKDSFNTPDDPGENLASLMINLKQTYQILGMKSIEKAIALVGPTGAGKSTMANAFQGKKILGVENEGIIQAFLIDEHGSDQYSSKIGNFLFESETKIAKNVYINPPGLNLFDLAGFFDTESIQEIVNAFALKQILSSCKELSYILIIQEADIKCARGSIFIKTLDFVFK